MYCEKVYERYGKNLFWYIKISGEISDKLKARDVNETSLSTYDFSTLYTTLPQNVIKYDSNVLIFLKEPSKEKALLSTTYSQIVVAVFQEESFCTPSPFYYKNKMATVE